MSSKSFLHTIVCASLFNLLWVTSAESSILNRADYVVTTSSTEIMDGQRVLVSVDSGRNYRVENVNGNWIAVKHEVGGEMKTGWIRREHLLKIDPDYRAVYSDKDFLNHNQWQTRSLPKNMPLTIVLEATRAIDVFVVTDEGKLALQQISKYGKGEMSSRMRHLNITRGSYRWSPPDNNQYYLLLDNSAFPDNGANSRARIEYSLAFCIDDPKPEEPKRGLGMLIGQVSLEFDGFEGRHERFQDPITVVIEAAETKDGQGKQEHEVQADERGYFILDNVDPSRQYRVDRLKSGSMSAPVTAGFSFPIAGPKNQKQRIKDAGHYQLVVKSDKKVHTTIYSDDLTVRSEGNGSVSLMAGAVTSPLDRHEWFLRKFPDSGWVTMVEADRNAIYKAREEAARKRAEKERQKQEQEKKSLDSKQEKPDTPPAPPMKNSEPPKPPVADVKPPPPPADAAPSPPVNSERPPKPRARDSQLPVFPVQRVGLPARFVWLCGTWPVSPV